MSVLPLQSHRPGVRRLDLRQGFRPLHGDQGPSLEAVDCYEPFSVIRIWWASRSVIISVIGSIGEAWNPHRS